MFISRSELGAIERRLRHVEALLEAIAARLEIPEATIADASRPRVSPEVAQLAAQGRPIEAIRLLRQEQGLDLATAKRVVDELGS